MTAARSGLPAPILRQAWAHGWRVGTLMLGATLSIGGGTEAFDSIRAMADMRERAPAAAQRPAQVLPQASGSPEMKVFSPAAWSSQGPDRRSAGRLTVIGAAARRQFLQISIPFGTLIHEKSSKYDVDPALVAAVIETESSFQTDARSGMGARGLMQLMPGTGRWLGAKNLNDPGQNIEAGAKYLSYLSKRFDGNLRKTIAAYNAGEAAVDRYDGIPPYRETRNYVARVLSRYRERKSQMGAASRPVPNADPGGPAPGPRLSAR
jgi:soluble lytic murein transglycosylase-like protein